MVQARVLEVGFVLILGAILFTAIAYLRRWQWTGFLARSVTDDEEPPKLLWEWLELILIPAVLAIAGWSFTASQARQAQEEADLRLQDTVLLEFYRTMDELLLSHDLLDTVAREPARLSARVHSLNSLSRLDAYRRGLVLSHLYGTGLINDQPFPIVSLQGSDLDGVDAKSMFLAGADLSGASMQHSDLRSATLRDANLTGVDLSGADLAEADLGAADLKGAILSGANFSGAILSGVDFTDATGLTASQLRRSANYVLTEGLPDAIPTDDRSVPPDFAEATSTPRTGYPGSG